VGDEAAVGPPPDHVGKGAAAIDPKIPASVRLHCHAPGLPAALYGVQAREAKRFASLPGWLAAGAH
jgi:hypothetical protein